MIPLGAYYDTIWSSAPLLNFCFSGRGIIICAHHRTCIYVCICVCARGHARERERVTALVSIEQKLWKLSKVFQRFSEFQSAAGLSNFGIGRSYFFPVLHMIQRHPTCNYSLLKHTSTNLSKNRSSKDKVRRRSAHAHRDYVHDENVRVLVAAWVCVVVPPIIVVELPS